MRGDSAAHLLTEEVVGSVECLGRSARDGKPRLQFSQLEVGLSGVRDDRDEDTPLRFFRREILGETRFRQPADAAPEIELPGEPEVDLVKVPRTRAARLDERRLAAPGPPGLVSDLR